MSEDIKAGDVVVCVDAALAPELREFSAYRTAAVCRHDDGLGLQLFSVTPVSTMREHCCFKIERFRKIDAADEQFTREMRACRPVSHELERQS